MKVSELNPPELDYWVAKAEDWEVRMQAPPHWSVYDEIMEMWLHGPSFSLDWQYGGPIIESKHIDLQKMMYTDIGWYAIVPGEGNKGKHADTPLIAAMRAYVASKFGEEVNEDNH